MEYETNSDEWDIIPNTGIGAFRVHDTRAQIEAWLNAHQVTFTVETRNEKSYIRLPDMCISFDGTQHVFAISGFNGFKGKLRDCIGLGDNLADVQNRIEKYIPGQAHCEVTYQLAECRGIEFLTSDDDAYDDPDDDFFDETAAPIVKITVWDTETWPQQTGFPEPK